VTVPGEARLLCSSLIGRPVESRRDLSYNEAVLVLKRLGEVPGHQLHAMAGRSDDAES
jgi:hypothetical protein